MEASLRVLPRLVVACWLVLAAALPASAAALPADPIAPANPGAATDPVDPVAAVSSARPLDWAAARAAAEATVAQQAAAGLAPVWGGAVQVRDAAAMYDLTG